MCDSPMCSTGKAFPTPTTQPTDPALATMPADQMQALMKAGAFLGSPTTVEAPNRGPAHSEMFGRMLQAAEDFPAPKKYRGK